MSTTLQFLGRTLLVPAVGLAGLIVVDVVGSAGADQPGGACDHAAVTTPFCGGMPFGSDAMPVQGAAALERSARTCRPLPSATGSPPRP